MQTITFSWNELFAWLRNAEALSYRLDHRNAERKRQGRPPMSRAVMRHTQHVAWLAGILRQDGFSQFVSANACSVGDLPSIRYPSHPKFL